MYGAAHGAWDLVGFIALTLVYPVAFLLLLFGGIWLLGYVIVRRRARREAAREARAARRTLERRQWVQRVIDGEIMPLSYLDEEAETYAEAREAIAMFTNLGYPHRMDVLTDSKGNEVYQVEFGPLDLREFSQRVEALRDHEVRVS